MADSGGGLFGSSSVSAAYRMHLEPVIFGPWARRLVEFAGLQPGQKVLDVAAGTGVVARTASEWVGRSGRVIASDISEDMLAEVDRYGPTDSADIKTLVCAATDLQLPDASVDVVLCQQGFPFIPDRSAAVREMRRVLVPGGRAAVAVWLSGPRLEPFATYGDALAAVGVNEPFPGAYDTTRFTMPIEEVADVLASGGLDDIEVTTQQVTLEWATPDAAAQGISGTPYATTVVGLPPDRQDALMTVLRQAMTDASARAVTHVMTAVLARGTRHQNR